MNDWWNSHEFETAAILLTGTLAVSLLLWAVHRHCGRHRLTAQSTGWRGLVHAAVPPLQFAAWYYCAFFAIPLALHAVRPSWQEPLNQVLGVWLWHLGLLVGIFWFLYRAVRLVEIRLGANAATVAPAGRFDPRIFPFLALALRTFIPYLAVWTLLQLLPLSPSVHNVLDKAITIAFIIGLAWIVQHAILTVERGFLTGLDPQKTENFAARGIETRVRILRKLAIVVNILLALAFILIQFDEVRTFGKSILASAGIAGIVLGFAAQQTLGTLFAGLQIALSQPIRLGDWIVVEGESGAVEEITLTYVVIRIWDLRRLVLPITYFVQKPFQNWTRASTSLIASVKVRVDFSLPLEPVRAEMKKWVEAAPQWNKEVYAFQVTDSDGATMELRIIASAPTSGASFDLQCGIREKLITYLQGAYPHCLPRTRQENIASDLTATGEKAKL